MRPVSDDDGEVIGGFLSDSRVTEAERFREAVAEWLLPPDESQPSRPDRLRRCLKEAAGQVTEDEQRRLMDFYGKSVEHKGIPAPTFCELVAVLGRQYLAHCETKFVQSNREKFASTLLRCDFDLLSSEVSRELRWLGKRLLDQPSDEPPETTAEMLGRVVDNQIVLYRRLVLMCQHAYPDLWTPLAKWLWDGCKGSWPECCPEYGIALVPQIGNDLPLKPLIAR